MQSDVVVSECLQSNTTSVCVDWKNRSFPIIPDAVYRNEHAIHCDILPPDLLFFDRNFGIETNKDGNDIDPIIGKIFDKLLQCNIFD